MLAFFVTVGLGASHKPLVKGGILLIIYWGDGRIISDVPECHRPGGGTAMGLEAPYPAVLRHLHDRRTRRGSWPTVPPLKRSALPPPRAWAPPPLTFGLISAYCWAGTSAAG